MSQPIQLYLASQSPRRTALLRQIGVSFQVVTAAADESPHPGEGAAEYVVRIAADKAAAGRAALPSADCLPVLAADTAVVLDAAILGKPADRAAGLAMLQRLSGRTHRVLTAVCLLTAERSWSLVSETRVRLRDITEAEASKYWATGEPLDKAGGYAIQGYGALFVTGIEGSYSGVVGLPLCETGTLLQAAGVSLMGGVASA